MEPKDIVTAFFGAAVGLAGILLVFVGFVYSHGETLSLKADRDRFKLVAKIGLIPFLISLGCGWACVRWMLHPSLLALCWARYLVYASMGLTALYGIVAFLFYL